MAPVLYVCSHWNLSVWPCTRVIVGVDMTVACRDLKLSLPFRPCLEAQLQFHLRDSMSKQRRRVAHHCPLGRSEGGGVPIRFPINQILARGRIARLESVALFEGVFRIYSRDKGI